MLEEVLRLFPHISSVNITGCSQFGDLTLNYKKVSWLKFQHPRSGELRSRLRSLKQTTDVAKSKGLGGDTDDFGNLKDYFDRVEKRDSANQLFRRSLYKRSKLYDARKSSAILSRDARIRRWAIKKSEHGYKRVEEFLSSSLRGIMKQNTFDFFDLKVLSGIRVCCILCLLLFLYHLLKLILMCLWLLGCSYRGKNEKRLLR